jgi:hypothetical protein
MKPLTMTVISLPLLALAPVRSDLAHAAPGDGVRTAEVTPSGSHP